MGMPDDVSKQTKTVVLLGAGASVEAGLRTSADLTQAIYEDIQSKGHLSEYARLLAYLITRLQARNAARGLSPYQPIEIEELFDALSIVFKRDTLLVSQFVERWDRGLDSYGRGIDERRFKKALDAIINKHIASAASGRRVSFIDSDYRSLVASLKPNPLLAPKTPDLPEAQQPFFSSLLRHLAVNAGQCSYLAPLCDIEAVSAVATLNYDLALETCCQEVGVEFDYGLTRWTSHKRVEWVDRKKLRIMKLHGSVNWTGNPEEIKVRDDDIRDYERRVMVFGGVENKLSADGPFLQFLYRLERALLTAGSLLVVGYSFKDSHINALINRWVLTRRSSRLVIVDPATPGVRFASGRQDRKIGDKTVSYHLRYRHLRTIASEGIKLFFEQPDLFEEGASAGR
jgi:hypothetical protein